jgi:hypothetical protein
MAAKKAALVLSPEILLQFAQVDPGMPSMVTRAGIVERTQEYRYAMAALFCGLAAFGCVVGGFIYLVMNNHPNPASALLVTGILSLVGAFLRSRLRQADEPASLDVGNEHAALRLSGS